ncbi:MAG: SDR family oxidoreductase [Hyphomicrobiaceae bacterium]
MDLGIAGRRALLCGASRGLGFACALALAQEGVRPTIVARDERMLTSAAHQIQSSTGQPCQTIVADLATELGRRHVIDGCAGIDILLTNNGGPPSKDFSELCPADWQKAFETNLLPAIELVQAVVPGMANRGFGRIINITSMTVRMPVERLDLSTATRMALTGYAAGVARQVAKHNITINNLLPGTIMTERVRDLGETAQRLIDKVPMGRAGQPAEFGAACAFLCSVSAAFITGQNLLVDGGLCPITI